MLSAWGLAVRARARVCVWVCVCMRVGATSFIQAAREAQEMAAQQQAELQAKQRQVDEAEVSEQVALNAGTRPCVFVPVAVLSVQIASVFTAPAAVSGACTERVKVTRGVCVVVVSRCCG